MRIELLELGENRRSKLGKIVIEKARNSKEAELVEGVTHTSSPLPLPCIPSSGTLLRIDVYSKMLLEEIGRIWILK